MIKLSAPDWCFFKQGMDPEEYYGRLAELGYAGAEMVAPERFAAAKAAGLELVNLATPDLDIGLNRIENHPKQIQQARDTIALAGDNAVGHAIIYSGNRGGQPDERGIDNCRRAIEQLIPHAERAGVTLAFEMLNVHDHPDHQAAHGEFGFTLARLIDSPRLRILYDVYHMERMGDDGAADITSNLDLIAHLHVAESPGRGAPKKDGNIEYGRLVPKAVAAGYHAYWGMEFEPAGDPLEELAAAVRLFRKLSEE